MQLQLIDRATEVHESISLSISLAFTSTHSTKCQDSKIWVAQQVTCLCKYSTVVCLPYLSHGYGSNTENLKPCFATILLLQKKLLFNQILANICFHRAQGNYFISLVTHFCICMSFCGLPSFMVPNFPSLVVCLNLVSSSSHVITSFIILMTYTFAVAVDR